MWDRFPVSVPTNSDSRSELAGLPRAFQSLPAANTRLAADADVNAVVVRLFVADAPRLLPPVSDRSAPVTTHTFRPRSFTDDPAPDSVTVTVRAVDEPSCAV